MFHAIDIVAVIAGMNMLALLLTRRKRSRERTERRLSQLSDAALLLRKHGASLEKFLSDPDSPDDLKSVLIGFSDAMADETGASAIAERFCDLRSERPPISQEGLALIEALAGLRSWRPDLADTFTSAIGSAIAAGFLRWPKAAQSLESIAARFVADPNREVVAAAEGARLRTGFRFGMKPVTVMA
jgi:hypothetical protein